MPKISRFDLEEKRIRELIGQLWNGFTLLQDRNEVSTFFSKFFTPTEIQMFAKRLELLKLADSGLEVGQLQKMLHLSKVTIYDWFDKHDSYEREFHIIIDRLKELDKEYLVRLQSEIEKAGKIVTLTRSTLDFEPPKDKIKIAKVNAYIKRKKRKSVVDT